MTPGNIERLGQFARPRAKAFKILHPAPFSHQLNSGGWLKRAKEHKPIGLAFHEHIEHPMDAITEIDVGRAGFVSFDKFARARADKGVRRLITDGAISFRFDNDSGTSAPVQLRSR